MFKNFTAGVCLALGLLLFYYSSFYKKYDYSYFIDSIVASNVEKLKNIESIFSDIYKDGKLNNLQSEKEKAIYTFLDKTTIFKKNIVQNNYPTLQVLFDDFLKTYNNKDYNIAVEFVERMRTVVRDSSLLAGEKIDLFTEIKDISQSLNDIYKYNSDIVYIVSSTKKKLNDSIDDFSKDTVIKNSSEKIKKIENTKYLLNIISFCLILFGLVNFLFEYLYIRKNIDYEVKIITETCNSITKGSDADVLLKLKKLRYFKKLKNNIFETIKMLSNKLEFFKDLILEINIPISFKDDEGNITKNNEYNKIESYIGNSFFIKNEKYYEKQNQGSCEYFCYMSKDNIRKNLDEDIILDIKNSDYSKLSPELKELVIKIKETDLEKTKLITKFNRLLTRTKSFINKLRVKNLENNNYNKSLEKEILNYKEAITSTKKVCEKIVAFKESIKSFIDNYNKVEAVFENLNVSKEFLNKDVDNLEEIVKDFYYSQNLLDAFYKNLILKNFKDTTSILEIKARLSNLSSVLTNFKQTFLKYKVSQDQGFSIDMNKLKYLETFYNELLIDLEKINLFIAKTN